MVPEIVTEIKRLAGGKGLISIMEVCGTHTVAVYRSGLPNLLPPNLRLIAGPGCPVCVTSEEDIYAFCLLSRAKEVIVTTFGDLLRVPASGTSLEKERVKGADVRLIYSPIDSLVIAKENPDKKVVLLGIGFETTAAPIAATILEAERRRLKNFFLLSVIKTIPPVMAVLLDSDRVQVDGFLCPGHVSTIIGAYPYEFIPKEYKKPAVITGFEPEDILEGIVFILRQIRSGLPRVEIQYRRAVKPEGNRSAQSLISRVFQPCETSWRGLGKIPGTGLQIKKKFHRFDGWHKFEFPAGQKAKVRPACRCGEVIIGAISPEECKLFRSRCNPERPMGPCMVSGEGTCSTHYKYQLESGTL